MELKTQKQWKEFIKSGEKPNYIPSTPNKVYKDDGWLSFGDWLGTTKGFNGEYLSYNKAKEITSKLGLKNVKEWMEYSKSFRKPVNIPTRPNSLYKKKGWKDWSDWLGAGNIATKNKTFLPFEEARDFVHKLNLKSSIYWIEYRKSDKKPNNIPSNPNVVYKNNGWKGMPDFLGYEKNKLIK